MFSEEKVAQMAFLYPNIRHIRFGVLLKNTVFDNKQKTRQ